MLQMEKGGLDCNEVTKIKWPGMEGLTVMKLKMSHGLLGALHSLATQVQFWKII